MDCLLLGTSGHIGTACFLLGRETLLEFLRIDFYTFYTGFNDGTFSDNDA